MLIYFISNEIMSVIYFTVITKLPTMAINIKICFLYVVFKLIHLVGSN